MGFPINNPGFQVGWEKGLCLFLDGQRWLLYTNSQLHVDTSNIKIHKDSPCFFDVRMHVLAHRCPMYASYFEVAGRTPRMILGTPERNIQQGKLPESPLLLDFSMRPVSRKIREMQLERTNWSTSSSCFCVTWYILWLEHSHTQEWLAVH